MAGPKRQTSRVQGAVHAASSGSSLLLWPGSARCACRHSMGPLPCTAAWLLKPRNASMARRPAGTGVGNVAGQGQLVRIEAGWWQQGLCSMNTGTGCTQTACCRLARNVPWLPWEPPFHPQHPLTVLQLLQAGLVAAHVQGVKGRKGAQASLHREGCSRVEQQRPGAWGSQTG